MPGGRRVRIANEGRSDYWAIEPASFVRGQGLVAEVKPANVERAVKLSSEKNCTATIIFEKTAKVEHSFEIIEDASAV